MSNFQQEKKKQLSKIDKSDKGSWDSKIIKLIEKINKKKQYYTTSSCSGRIILIKDAEKKQKNLFLFRSHELISFNKLIKELEKIKRKFNELVWFKLDSCILHVSCASLNDAQKLVDKAKFAGWKRSGIMATRNRIMCELLSTESLGFPILDNGKILVDEDYLKLIVNLANLKLENIWEKIRKLEKLI